MPRPKGSVRRGKERSSLEQEEEALRSQQWRGKEGKDRFLVSVSTEGRRKTNDAFHLPAPWVCTHWVPWRDPPPCSHPTSPQGAPRERGFSSGMLRSGGTGWTPPEQWAAMGTGCPRTANPPGLGINAAVTAGAEATPAPSSRAMICSVFCQPGASGWLSLTAGGDPMEPPHRLSCSEKSFPAFPSLLPWELLSWGSAGAPSLRRKGAVPAPGKMQLHSQVRPKGSIGSGSEHRHWDRQQQRSLAAVCAVRSEISLSTALTLNHSKRLCNSPGTIRKQQEPETKHP